MEQQAKHDVKDPHPITVPIMAGQGAMSVVAWSMASPSIVMTFLAVAMDLPVILAGLLVTIRHSAGTLSDVFLSGRIAKMTRKKSVIARIDLAVAMCFLLVVLAVLYGSKPLVIAAFVAGIFMIGVLEEIKSLMIIDFISDNLASHDRMRVTYLQKAIGGGGTIVIALLLHHLMQEAPALTRHSVVVGIGAVCFVLSAMFLMFMHEAERTPGSQPKSTQSVTLPEKLRTFWQDMSALLGQAWFRKFIVIRMSFIFAGLSLPFYALIAAESHHGSTSGLTALVVSSAAALLVSAPMWRALSAYSNRAVMIAGALMVAASGLALIVIHNNGLDHTVHLHAASLFVATVAVTGLGTARTLYFMDVAPKPQRVKAMAISKTLGRLAIVSFSALLAAIAHMNEVTWAVVAISIGSLIAVLVVLSFVEPTPRKDGAPNPQ